MSYMKRFAEQIAVELGKDDILDPEVIAEAERRMASPTQPFQYWQSYHVDWRGKVQILRSYHVGHSMKCKWTGFLNDHHAHGTPGKWRVVEDSETRKAVAYDDRVTRMVVFQLITLDALVVPPPTTEEEYKSLGRCIEDGTHLTECDDDGYCNFCGEQDSSEVSRNEWPGY